MYCYIINKYILLYNKELIIKVIINQKINYKYLL